MDNMHPLLPLLLCFLSPTKNPIRRNIQYCSFGIGRRNVLIELLKFFISQSEGLKDCIQCLSCPDNIPKFRKMRIGAQSAGYRQIGGVSKIGQSGILTTSVSPQNERSQHPRRCWLLLFCGIVARGGFFLVDTFQNIVTNDCV